MAEKKVTTTSKTKTIVIVVVGLLAFLGFLFALIMTRSTINSISRRLNTKVVYEGVSDPVDQSQDVLVTVANKEVSGTPEIRDTDPVLGTAAPKITIIEFASFGSGYSAAAQPIVQQIMDNYGSEVKLVFKDYFNQSDAMASLGAKAARCAQAQNKFWEMEKQIFQTTDGFEKSDIIDIAKNIGLTEDTFTTCLDKTETDSAVSQNISDGIELHLSAVPTFFVDDKVLTGIVTYDEFEALVIQELEGK
ncbi:MAG: thioredoxin domain-containing protein [Patescibacteria group bacterium]